jgi:hypothetical protein
MVEDLQTLLQVPDKKPCYEIRQVPPRTNTAIWFCNDPWFREQHKQFFRGELHLGLEQGAEDFLPCPVLGGGAIFVHPEVAAAQIQSLRDTLETLRTNFGTITKLLMIGHVGCKRMAEIYQQMGLPLDSGIDYIRRDLIALARAFESRNQPHVCLIGQLFREYNLDVEVYYLRPGIKEGRKVLWFEKIEPHFE